MQIIKLDQVVEQPGSVEEIVRTLESGGLVCIPCNGKYRIMADLQDPDAVRALQQSKRRTHKAPSLVFVDSEAMLEVVAAQVTPLARRMAQQLWPGPLTILFEANPNLLPRKSLRELTKVNGKLGVRIPDDSLCRQIVSEFGGPLLVSSANRQRRHGESSPAQIRKNFIGRISLFVDDGDLTPEPSSTVVDIEEDHFTVKRAGAIEDTVLQGLLS